MTKTLRRIGQLFTICLFVFATNTAMAQNAITVPANPKMEMAKERFETTHDVTLTDVEFREKLQASNTNLADWDAVLATYTHTEIKTQLQASPASLTSKGVQSDSDYYYIRDIVNRMRRNL